MTNIYIPITETSLKTILTSEGPLFFEPEIDISEAIGLTALQGLPVDHPDPASLVESGLEHLFSLWSENYLGGTQDIFRKQLFAHLDREKLKIRITQLDRWRICPVRHETVKSRQFLTVKGQWDPLFKETYTGDRYAIKIVRGLEAKPGYLTDSQYRIVERTSANLDEPLNIHGYAGAGKTFLIRILIDLLAAQNVKPANILILSLSSDQLNGLLTHLPKEYHRQGITFGKLAGRILPKEYWKYNDPEKNSKPLDCGQVIAYYNIKPIASMGENEIINNITRTVHNFCQSAVPDLMPENLPKQLQKRTKGGWQGNEVLRAFVLRTAKDLWSKIFDLGFRDFYIPVRDYHRVKFAAQIGGTISTKHSHVIVDESHDITPPLRQILDASTHCASITLGDGFQNFNGNLVDLSRDIKTLDLGRSFRSGQSLEEVIIPITTNHLYTPPEIYRGSTDIYTAVTYYQKPEIPEKPTGILVSDHWAMWEWIQRIAGHAQSFKLIGTSHDINHFVKDVFRLKNNGGKPTHWSIAKYYIWDNLVTDLLPKNTAFKSIFEMIEKGYTLQDFLQAMASRYISVHNVGDWQATHVIARAENSRNHEFERVLLTPDMVSLTDDQSQSYVRSMIQRSIIYVSVSRGQFEVQAPLGIREWIEEISARPRNGQIL